MRVRTVLDRLVNFKGFVLVEECLVTTEDGMELEIVVRPRANARARCSRCHAPASIYDHQEERRFRFPALWFIPVFLVYGMRRVQCAECGVKVESEHAAGR